MSDAKKCKCSVCGRYVDEFVPNCCSECYLKISSELSQQYFREVREYNERNRRKYDRPDDPHYVKITPHKLA